MNRRFASRVVPVCLLALTLAFGMAGLASAQDATPATGASPVAAAATTLQITGLVATPLTLTAADIRAFPQQTVEVDFQSGKGVQHHTYTGALLSDVIAKAGPTTDATIKNDALRFFLVVTSNDGYTVVISWGEIDPNFGNSPYLLAWEEDGQPLSGSDGPVRLVTPGDVKGGRYVTGVVSIEVRHA